jgi:DHA2 family methylenomycin A resistance protein-like MFS transporter
VTRKPALVLAASTLGFGMVLLDTTVVNVAGPVIRDDLGAGDAALQWIVNAYTLVFAALLLSMGALSDRLGARTIFLGGLATFAVGSVAAAAAPSAGALIAAQALLGVGAASVLPTSLSLLTQAYPGASARARAVGIWAAGSAVAFALGPVVGGGLTDALGWRSVFVVNLLPAVAGGLLAWRFAPRGRPGATRGTDPSGQLATIVGLGALTFALIEGGDRGWTSVTALVAFAAALAAVAWLVPHQRRAAAPLLPSSLVGDRRFTAATGAGALVNLAFYGEFFVLSLFLQQERGLSALEVGLSFLPQPLLVMALAPVAGRLVAAAGPRLPLAVGGVAGTLGAIALLAVDSNSSYLVLAAGLVLNGVAGGLMIPAVTGGVMGAAPAKFAGVASAGLNAGRQVGGVIGVALLGSLATAGDPVAGLHVALVLAAVALAGATLLSRTLPATRADAVAPARAVA